MTYRILLAALVAFSLSTPVEAQIQFASPVDYEPCEVSKACQIDPVEGTPLRAMCLSSVREYCMSIYRLDFWYNPDTYDSVLGHYQQQKFRTVVQLWGSGLHPSNPLDLVDFFLWGISGDDQTSTWRDVSGPGFYQSYDGGSSGPTTDTHSNAHEHVGWLRFSPDLTSTGSSDFCTPSTSTVEGDCYEIPVPEPAPWLMVLVGAFGIALARGRLA